jgi:hypothetical protein
MTDDDSIPLADDFDAAATSAQQAGEEYFAVKLPWQAGVVIAGALRSYFGAQSPMRCFVCDNARNNEIDMVIDRLQDEAQRISMLLMSIEGVMEEQTGTPAPTLADVKKARAESYLRDARSLPKRPHMPYSDELRAIAIAWKEKA